MLKIVNRSEEIVKKNHVGEQKPEGSPPRLANTSMWERVIDERWCGPPSCSLSRYMEKTKKQRVVDPVIHIRQLHYDD